MNKLDERGLLTEEAIKEAIAYLAPERRLEQLLMITRLERDALLELFTSWIKDEFPSYREQDGTISQNQFAIKFKRRMAKLSGFSG